MLSVTRLLTGTATPGDALRYGRLTGDMPAHLLHFSADKKPIVVWNLTRRCNLSCMHCYSDSHDEAYGGELTTREGKALLDDLAEFGVPTVLFSGGEPLTRPDLFELAAYARDRGLRCILSTNGTLITPEAARKIQSCGFSYVGVSLDGVGPVHDKIRGKKGAYDAALAGLRLCRDLGTRVGLRFTVHKRNLDELPAAFDLLETEDIPRCCVYHLAYAGRGERLRRHDLEPAETREVVEEIFDRAQEQVRRGVRMEVLTVDNPVDNVLLLMRVRRIEPERAVEVEQLLRWNGGNQSGIAIACVDPQGRVHPDQFSWHHTVGHVREERFGEIWTDANPALRPYRQRPRPVRGRCDGCRFFDLCNGGLRVRAESAAGDPTAPDPACYLTDEEIAA